MIIKIRAIRCKHCGEIIYSRSHYDMNYCKCKTLAIDGGVSIVGDSEKNNPSYLRVKGKLDEDYENIIVELNEFNTRKECRRALFIDYNKNINKYGRVND